MRVKSQLFYISSDFCWLHSNKGAKPPFGISLDPLTFFLFCCRKEGGGGMMRLRLRRAFSLLPKFYLKFYFYWTYLMHFPTVFPREFKLEICARILRSCLETGGTSSWVLLEVAKCLEGFVKLAPVPSNASAVNQYGNQYAPNQEETSFIKPIWQLRTRALMKGNVKILHSLIDTLTFPAETVCHAAAIISYPIVL